MALQTIAVTQAFAAPIDSVFNFFADHVQFGRIWPGQFRRIKDGDDPAEPNGLNSEREIRVGPIPGLMIFKEAITAFERPGFIEYRVIGFGPVKNHVGRLRFSEQGDGTLLDYKIEFESRVPGIGGMIAKDLEKQWHAGIGPIVQELEAAT